jgi:hypothetical protein
MLALRGKGEFSLEGQVRSRSHRRWAFWTACDISTIDEDSTSVRNKHLSLQETLHAKRSLGKELHPR